MKKMNVGLGGCLLMLDIEDLLVVDSGARDEGMDFEIVS